MWKYKSIDNEKIALYLCYFLVFLLPLISTTFTYEEYEFPKTFFLYFLGSLIAFFSIIAFFKEKTRLVVPHKALLFFVGIYTLSTLFSTHLYTSVWGYYTRHFGGLLSVLILFLLSISLINNKYFVQTEYRGCFLKVIALTGLPIGLYGVIQYISGDDRVSSTIGQPNWLAAYLVMLFPIFLHLFLKSGLKEKIFWFLIMYVSYGALWFSYSISGVLGLFSAATVFIFINFETVRMNKKLLTAVFLSLISTSFLFPGLFKDKIRDFWLDAGKIISQSLVSYAQDSYHVSDPGFIRTGLWKGTINLATSSLRNLTIGTGPETFPYNFPPFRPTELNYSSEWDFIFNKPHNYYLELLSNIGLPGLISFLFLILIILKNRHPYITASMTGFFVTIFFGWPTSSTTLMFFILYSILSVEKKLNSDINLEKIKPSVRKAGVVLTPLLTTIFLIIIGRYFMADVFSSSADVLLHAGDITQSIQFLDKAVLMNSNEAIYKRWRAKAYLAKSASASEQEKANLKRMALEDLETAYDLNPNNLATTRNSVPLYYFLAVNDLNRKVDESNIDWNYLPLASEYMENLKSRSPTDAGIYVLTAEYENKLQLETPLKESMRKIKQLRPDLLEWHEKLLNIDVSF